MDKEKYPAINTEEYKRTISEMFKKAIEKNDEQEEERNAPIDEVKKKWDMNDQITKLFANKIKSDTELKSSYAVILVGILVVQLLILDLFFVLKGCNILKFADSTFNIFITGGLAEIYVLVKIIVQYLFNDNLTELLKIILRTNNNNNYRDNKKDNKKNKEN